MLLMNLVLSSLAGIQFMNFIEIQSWPEIPSIGYFVSLFSSCFNLPDFDIEVRKLKICIGNCYFNLLCATKHNFLIFLRVFCLQDLEEALTSSENSSIDDSTATELAPRLIPELIVSLLRGCDLVKSWPNITTSNYQMFLRRLFRHKCDV